jgi:hypothetical protein
MKFSFFEKEIEISIKTPDTYEVIATYDLVLTSYSICSPPFPELLVTYLGQQILAEDDVLYIRAETLHPFLSFPYEIFSSDISDIRTTRYRRPSQYTLKLFYLKLFLYQVTTVWRSLLPTMIRLMKAYLHID